MMEKGLINTSPKGEPLKLLLGVNKDEFALFVVAIPLVIPKISFPITNTTMKQIVAHLVGYHDHWNQTTVGQIMGAYPPDRYNDKEAYRIVQAGTDARCQPGP
jgi:hypothetical protein